MDTSVFAYLGLGSNLASPKAQLMSALKTLSNSPELTILNQSSFYVSTAVDNTDQPLYWNMVIKIKTTLSPFTLLNVIQKIEASHHSVKMVRWGPRILDIDILLYEDIKIASPSLSIPHKEMLHRDFVLVPLYEIEPDLMLPNGKPLKSYYQTVPTHIVKRDIP